MPLKDVLQSESFFVSYTLHTGIQGQERLRNLSGLYTSKEPPEHVTNRCDLLRKDSETDRIVSQQSTTRQATSGIMRPARWKPAATDGPLLYPVPFGPPDRLACYVGGLVTGVLITSRP